MDLTFLTPIAVGLHISSAHFHPQEFQNNINTGIYFRAPHLQLGAYKNTFRGLSVYGGYVFTFDNSPFELLAGAATGYKKRTEYYQLDHYKIPQTVGKATIIPMYALSYAHKVSPNLAVRGFVNHSFVNVSLEYSWK